MTSSFDDLLTDSASAFIDALSSAVAIYRPKNGPAIPDITIMYDAQLFEPDPVGDGLVQRDPQITIETSILSKKVKQHDRFDFTDVKGNEIKVKVEHNEGDDLGLTALRVRVI